MIDYSKLFVFESDKFGRIIIRAEENMCPSEVIKMYVDWYENEYKPKEEEYFPILCLEDISISDFVFVESYYWLDFYSDKINRLNRC